MKNSKEFHVPNEEYIKIYKTFRKNPVASLAGKIPDHKDSNGNFRSGAEILRNLEKIQLEKIAKDNNIIKIDNIKSK